MLAGHRKLSCGPETRFFHFLSRADWNVEADPDLERAIDFLFDLNLAGQPVPHHYRLSAETLRSYLRVKSVSVATLLSSLTEQFMARQGKRRWVEKSPEHLLYANDIREFFPYSPIIRIVRDPRDVALSLARVSWGPRSYVEALSLWRRYEGESASFFCQDDNTYTIYYEELVRSPEAVMEDLCEFIGEEYEDQMLDTSNSARMLVTEMETHKQRVYKPPDRTRVQVWKGELSQENNLLAEALLGDYLRDHGYECRESFSHAAQVFPSLELLLNYPDSVVSLAAKGVRFWGDFDDAVADTSIFVGEPDQDRWLRYEKPARWWDLLTITAHIAETKLRHRTLYWVRDQNSLTGVGHSARLVQFVLGHVAQQPALNS
jgi:hypothetical protein